MECEISFSLCMSTCWYLHAYVRKHICLCVCNVCAYNLLYLHLFSSMLVNEFDCESEREGDECVRADSGGGQLVQMKKIMVRITKEKSFIKSRMKIAQHFNRRVNK